MSLTTLGSAFVIVAILFTAVAALSGRRTGGGWGVGARDSSPPPDPTSWGSRLRAVWLGSAFEALVVTLLAALWFDSLGHGGWVILFLLLGALPAGDRWVRRRLAGAAAGGEAGPFVASLLKYLLAGWICVWRLT